MDGKEESLEREIRRRKADWDFINRQPPRIRAALAFYVEHGDEYKAAKLAGLKLETFEELRIRARIPKVVWREGE